MRVWELQLGTPSLGNISAAFTVSIRKLNFKPQEKYTANLSADTLEEFFTRSSIEVTTSGLTSMELGTPSKKKCDKCHIGFDPPPNVTKNSK